MASITPLKQVPLILRLLLKGVEPLISDFPRGIVGIMEQIADVHPVGLRAGVVDHFVREGVDDLRAGHRGVDMVCIGFIEVAHNVAYRSGLKGPFVARPECGRVFSFRQECFASQLVWANQPLDGSRVPRNRAHKGGRGTEPKMRTEYCSDRKCSP